MPRIKWIGKIEDMRIQLRDNGCKPKKIAEILSNEFNAKITVDMVNGRERVYKNQSSSNSKKLFNDKFYNLKEEFIFSEKIKKDMKAIWEKFEDGKPKKILSLSDLHAPYMNFEKIEKAINDNLDCDICVLNGDIFDGEAMSSFNKMNEIEIEKEFEQILELLNVITTKFKWIVWNGGNHDLMRFSRYIMKNIKHNMRQYTFDRLNPIKYLTENYSNILTINYNTLQIGDVVFKHPNGYSNIEMRTVISEYDILSANKADLPNPNFKCICIGHTHYMGNYIKNDVLVIEQGCLCHIPDYRFNNPVKRRWTTGYARIELDKNNKVIFNKSKWVCLD